MAEKTVVCRVDVEKLEEVVKNRKTEAVKCYVCPKDFKSFNECVDIEKAKEIFEIVKSDPIGLRGVNSEIDRMREQLKRELEAAGHPPGRVSMALRLADEYTARISEVFTPRRLLENPEIRRAIYVSNYPIGMQAARNWAKAMGE